MELVKDSTYVNQDGVTKYLNSYNSNQDLEEQIIYFGSSKEALMHITDFSGSLPVCSFHCYAGYTMLLL